MRVLDIEKLSANIESRMKNDLDANNLSGASVLVKQGGKVVYKKHFGTTSPEGGEPISDSTIFRLASMTKPITAVAALILVQRGMLSLDDPIEKYIPKFKSTFLIDENGNKISNSTPPTIKHILTHTSGIGSGQAWVNSASKITSGDRNSVESFVNFVANQPLSFVPGTKCEYSGIGAFSVLTAIIEKLTGQSFECFLKKEIFEPCRMVNTTFSPSKEQWERMITMHAKADGKSIVGKTHQGCVFGDYPPTNPLGGGGLISTVNDYMNFADMLLGGGNFEGTQVISNEMLKIMSTPQIPESIRPGNQRWGLGVRVITNTNTLPVGSFGWSGAYGTHFWVDPENEIVGIYMKNSHFDGGAGAKTSAQFEKDVMSALI